jgi:hypothetical protein
MDRRQWYLTCEPSRITLGQNGVPAGHATKVVAQWLNRGIIRCGVAVHLTNRRPNKITPLINHGELFI